MPNLVLGIAANYTPSVLERYLGSLRGSGCTDDVILCIPEDQISEEHLRVCERYLAKVFPYQQSDAIEVCVRFKLFGEILESNGERYSGGMILHTDVRDVVFQRNPFEFDFPKSHELFFALEDGVIGECRFNTAWILEGFGREALESIKDRQISCAGTTIGTYRAILDYFKKMELVIFEDGPDGVSRTVRNDQGVHNYFFHNPGILDYQPMGLPNGKSPFLTIGLMKEVIITAEGSVAFPEMNVPAVLHQLDRLPPESLYHVASTKKYPMDDLLQVSIARLTPAAGPTTQG